MCVYAHACAHCEAEVKQLRESWPEDRSHICSGPHEGVERMFLQESSVPEES